MRQMKCDNAVVFFHRSRCDVDVILINRLMARQRNIADFYPLHLEGCIVSWSIVAAYAAGFHFRLLGSVNAFQSMYPCLELMTRLRVFRMTTALTLKYYGRKRHTDLQLFNYITYPPLESVAST